MDVDPARTELKRAIKAKREEESLTKRLRSAESLDSETDTCDPCEVLDVIYTMWGGANGGKEPWFKIQQCESLIGYVSGVSFRDAFLSWLFIAESLCDSYEQTAQAESFIRHSFEATLMNGELVLGLSRCVSKSQKRDFVDTINEFYSGSVKISAGDRRKAIVEIEHWCSNHAEDYLIVLDPSFKQNDISLLKVIRSAGCDCSIFVLTSRCVQSIDPECTSFEDSYKKAWIQIAGAESSGATEIVIIGAGAADELPIGQCALLSAKAGLLFGVSYSQLGVTRDATLQHMSQDEAAGIEDEVSMYLDFRRKSRGAPPFSVLRFTLD